MLEVLHRQIDHKPPLGNPQIRPHLPDDYEFEYKEDLTQWVKGNPPITVECTLGISRADDPALIVFVEKVAGREIHPDEVELVLGLKITADKTIATKLTVDGEPTDDQSAKETLTRLRGSNVLILHNSTTRQDAWYYGRGRLRAFYEVFLSVHEQDAVSQAEKTVQRQI